MLTPVAKLGPLLVAVIVKVTLDSTGGVALLTVLTTAISTLGETQIILEYVTDSKPNLLIPVTLTYLVFAWVTVNVTVCGVAKAAVVETATGATGKVVFVDASIVPVTLLPFVLKILN